MGVGLGVRLGVRLRLGMGLWCIIHSVENRCRVEHGHFSENVKLVTAYGPGDFLVAAGVEYSTKHITIVIGGISVEIKNRVELLFHGLHAANIVFVDRVICKP